MWFCSLCFGKCEFVVKYLCIDSFDIEIFDFNELYMVW